MRAKNDRRRNELPTSITEQKGLFLSLMLLSEIQQVEDAMKEYQQQVEWDAEDKCGISCQSQFQLLRATENLIDGAMEFAPIEE
tara:strand:- start:68 stop:319 length:252 start_codon:yes stop_codon:yes gene_type:complete